MAFISLIALSLALTAAATDPGYNCRPGMSCWPTQSEWAQFNTTLNGHLYATVPIAEPCYDNSTAACDVVEGYYGDSVTRGEYFGQTYWLNWETCGDVGCSLLETDPEVKLFDTCSIGRLASYYVDVRETEDITAAFKFAMDHNIRISIKNTGHDYYGRSSVPNTLAIWTHHLNTTNFYSNFTASNCPSSNGQNVGELGAGVIAGDAYRYFSTHGMDITGGYEQSVGIAGGFAQGGGVGSFTTTYGLMADNAIEFEVVTADGQVRVINECNDPDLFWAMRGGGGGTYAVLTKYRVQVYPSLPIHVYTFTANFTNYDASTMNATQNNALREIMTVHAQHQIDWSTQLITGQIEYFPEKFTVSLVLPYGDDGSKLRSATTSFAAYLSARTDLSVSANGYTSYSSYADYLTVTAAIAKVTEPSGIYSQLNSRLIPRTVFTDNSTIGALVDGVISGIATARAHFNLSGTQIVSETPLTNLDANHSTATHPAWRSSLWHVIQAGEWLEPLEPEAWQSASNAFLDLIQPLKDLSPGGGAYLNEAHWADPDWKDTFFGSNYERLLAVKGEYDPTHLFDCWKCVGWRGESDPFYSCWNEW